MKKTVLVLFLLVQCAIGRGESRDIAIAYDDSTSESSYKVQDTFLGCTTAVATKSDVISALSDYGIYDYEFLENTNYLISTPQITLGFFNFDYSDWNFTDGVLWGVQFVIGRDKYENAKIKFNQILAQLNKNYYMTKNKTNDYYSFDGRNYVTLDLKRKKSRGKKMRYYVTLEYFDSPFLRDAIDSKNSEL